MMSRVTCGGIPYLFIVRVSALQSVPICVVSRGKSEDGWIMTERSSKALKVTQLRVFFQSKKNYSLGLFIVQQSCSAPKKFS